MAEELDFENEGKNGERCYKELKHLKYIYVPKIFWDKTTKVSNSYISKDEVFDISERILDYNFNHAFQCLKLLNK